MSAGRAAVVTVGTELVTGLRPDTNSAEIAAALTAAGYRVGETVSVPDELATLAALLRRLMAEYALVIATGGLGPTHDDVTRDAAAQALGLPLERDASLERLLEPVALRHSDAEAAVQVYRQADVIAGAHVILPGVGTAPGQVVATESGLLALLPGPPAEMRPMLAEVLAGSAGASPPVSLGVSGMPESDAQVVAQRALEGFDGVGLTVLATPGDVRVVLIDDGAGRSVLAAAADAVDSALGDASYGTATLAEAVLAAARERGVRIATAESCTGGLVAATLTEVPGASDVFAGGVVAYSNAVKVALLAVGENDLEENGAVSETVARAMAEGCRERLGADTAVAVTGIAGPGGGTPAKPVGLVWFAVADAAGTVVQHRILPGDRERIRARAAVTALGMLRRRLMGR